MQQIASDKPIHHMTDEETRIAEKFLTDLTKTSMDPIKRMRKLYTWVDKLWNKGFKDAVVCKRGCSHCCYVNVSITAYEALYIEETTGHKITNGEHKKRGDYTLTPCHFLKDNECSIYESRPMACRVFGAFDSPEYCADPTFPAHYIISLVMPGAGGMDAANHAYMMILHYNDGQPIKDIREFFG